MNVFPKGYLLNLLKMNHCGNVHILPLSWSGSYFIVLIVPMVNTNPWLLWTQSVVVTCPCRRENSPKMNCATNWRSVRVFVYVWQWVWGTLCVCACGGRGHNAPSRLHSYPISVSRFFHILRPILRPILVQKFDRKKSTLSVNHNSGPIGSILDTFVVPMGTKKW